MPASIPVRSIQLRSCLRLLPLLVLPLVACGGSPQAIAEGVHDDSHVSSEHPSHGRDGETMEHGAEGHSVESGGHGHRSIEVPADQPLPTVGLKVHRDPGQGWNLEVQLENFAFTPQNIGRSSLSTEGHAHLYVNGEKITRLYGTWHHLPSLPPGRHTIKVNLNTNDHEVLTHQGQEIAAIALIEVLGEADTEN
ncbi:MAG: hypothetical protein ACO4AI_05250 [Prochlorothrix sp.]